MVENGRIQLDRNKDHGKDIGYSAGDGKLTGNNRAEFAQKNFQQNPAGFVIHDKVFPIFCSVIRCDKDDVWYVLDFYNNIILTEYLSKNILKILVMKHLDNISFVFLVCWC